MKIEKKIKTLKKGDERAAAPPLHCKKDGISCLFIHKARSLFIASLLLTLAMPYCADTKGILTKGPDLSVFSISAGGGHTCAVRGGGVKCWGKGYSGQLGNDSSGLTNWSLVPIDVDGLTAGYGATAVSAGIEHTCAVVSGGVKCWGNGGNGRLGYGDGGTDGKTTPTDVAGLTAGSGVTAVSAWNQHTCAVVNGGVKCWGDGENGRLGDGNDTIHNQTTPTNVMDLTAGSGVSAVSAGTAHTCAVVKGGVKCWGNGGSGRLGHGESADPEMDKDTPTDVMGLTAGSGATAVSAGARHTCAVVSGGVKCWGNGGSGRLGHDESADKDTPTDVHTSDSDPSPLSDATAVSAGSAHTCAVVKGGVKCWGEGANGRLGYGDTGDKATPEDVAELTAGVTAVSAGSKHTCALLENGGVKCWGEGSQGRLGNEPPTASTDGEGIPDFPLPVNVRF